MKGNIMKETNGVYNIPDQNLASFRKKIESLGKKAEKLTGDKIYCMVLGYNMVENEYGIADKVWEVHVCGPEPVLEGWKFLARIEHTDSGNIVRTIPDETVPERYRSTGRICDHCNKIRKRRDTFVVREIDTGDTKQVGSSCLKDFFGHGTPEKHAKLAELLADAHFYGASGGAPDGALVEYRWANVHTYLSWVAYSVRKYGYVTRKAARDRGHDAVSTANDAWDTMVAYATKKGFSVPLYTEDDVDVAEKTIEWVAKIGEKDPAKRSEYEHNVYVAVNEGIMEYRHVGLVASAVSCYLRSLEEANKNKSLKDSKHVGSVKDRLTFNVTLLSKTGFDGYFGWTVVHKFLTDDGNVLVWFATGSAEFKEDESYKVKATVKKHDEYKGVAQTVVNRVTEM